jgi:PAS domain S-box-containing protein
MGNDFAKTLLLVEDDSVMASAHAKLLEDNGYAVLIAETGERAIEQIKSLSFDLVLMDIDLGDGIDGTEAARQILNLIEIPIVFLTSHSEKELVEKVRNITRYGYVIKNSGKFVLLSSIEMAFELFDMQKKTKQKEEMFQMIAENTLDLIALHDVDGKYLYLSPSVERILGYKPEELIGASPYALFHPEDMLRIQNESHDKVKEGDDGIYISYRIRGKNGEYVWLETITKSIWNLEKTNVIQLQTVSRDITHRVIKNSRERELEQKIKESEERYRAMVESSLEAIYVHRDFKFIYANAAGIKLAGANTFEDLKGKNIFDFVHPAYQEQVHDRVENLYSEKRNAPIREERFIRLDKTIIEVEISANPIEFNGSFAVLVIARDITERKNHEKEIRNSEIRFQALIENLDTGVMVQDSNAKILVNNSAAEKLLGLSSDQMRGKTSFDKDWNVIHEDGTDFPGETHPVPVCIRTGKPVIDVIMGVYRPDTRDRVWLLVNAKPEFDALNQIKQVICTFQDITKSRAKDRLLQEKEERLRLAFMAGNQGLFDLDIKSGKAKVNSSYAQMLGYDFEDFEETNLNWKNRMHEEDRNETYNVYTDYIQGKRKDYSVEFRQRTKDGNWKWILSQGRIAEWDNDGNPTRMIGTHTDITQKKHFEFLQKARNHVLDSMIAKKNLSLILEEIIHEIESIHPDMKASILLLDSEKKLRKGAAPSLPDFYNEAIEGLQSGIGVGSCGTAAATGDLVIVADIQTHAYWKNFTELAEKANLRACWSFPFKDDSGRVLGTFAAYYALPKLPNRPEFDIIMEFSRITGLAVQNNKTEMERIKAEEEIKSLLIEKEILLKEVHHRIKNNMASISSLLSLQGDYVDNPLVTNSLAEARNRIMSMMLIYDKLFKSTDYKNISIQEYLNDLLDQVLLSFPSPAKIKIEKEIENFILNSKSVFSIGIIINELITNAFKYAFPESKAGIIIVGVKKMEEGKLELTVSDNGVGLPKDFSIENSKGFGLTLIKLLTQKKGNSFEIVPGNVTKFKVILAV